VIEAALAGAVAGYAIAIPVGAIAVLIIHIGIRDGFAHAAAGAAGAATADLIYATAASLAGLGVIALVGPLLTPLRFVGGAVLVAIGLRGLVALRDARAVGEAHDSMAPPRSARRTYLSLVALTLLNPATVVYFAALTMGLAIEGGVAERLAFSTAAFGASLSWQLLLAVFGTVLGRGSGARLRTPTVVLGNAVVICLGLLIVIDAFAVVPAA
jgi:threonine/homoserine/homoserine lactone efflux protein